MLRCRVWLCLLVTLSLVCGCGSKKAPEREPVELDLLISAEKDVNPNAKGRPSPLAVRIFALHGTGLFEESDYFSLQTDAKATLGDELLAVEASFVIRPGGRRELRKELTPGASALGIIAGYRNMDEATWQVLHPVPLPPEVGWFTSPAKIRLHIRLEEAAIQVLPLR